MLCAKQHRTFIVQGKTPTERKNNKNLINSSMILVSLSYAKKIRSLFCQTAPKVQYGCPTDSVPSPVRVTTNAG